MRASAKLGLLSAAIIESVCQRYGRPLEEGISAGDTAESLFLAHGRHLRIWLYKAPVDLESKRYILLDEDGKEPIALLSRQLSSALRFVLR